MFHLTAIEKVNVFLLRCCCAFEGSQHRGFFFFAQMVAENPKGYIDSPTALDFLTVLCLKILEKELQEAGVR